MLEIIYTLVVTHITIVCVTVYLHRGMTHRGLIFSPQLSHFMRFWLWLTTGMVTKEWVAVHRKHHRFTDEPEDPHSPKQTSLLTVLFLGTALYMSELTNKNLTKQYAPDIEDDWIEKKLYSKFSWLGLLIMAAIDVLLFGWIGLTIWAVQMIWIPFWAAGVINGVGHYWGYRNGETKDSSTNIIPWGIIIGGEELHNNHHLEPANPKLSKKVWELDIGWMWIKLFERFKLLSIRV
jgi:stearoyl-CoA desaturase (delta-9 desaturase)